MAAAAPAAPGPGSGASSIPAPGRCAGASAAVSAGLTLAILLVFGGAIGQIATQRIRDDFNNEVRSAVQILASEFEVVYPPFGRTGSVRKARS